MDTPRSDVVAPVSAASSPRMIENRVVLPAPFGPASPMRSSRFTCSVASANNTRSPYALLMPDRVNMNRQSRHKSLDSKAQNHREEPKLPIWRANRRGPQGTQNSQLLSSELPASCKPPTVNDHRRTIEEPYMDHTRTMRSDKV